MSDPAGSEEHGALFVRVMSAGLGACCAALLAGLSLLTVADVIGRYLLESPIPGAFELTQLMLGALVFAALPLTTHAGQHVEVDMLYGLSPRAVQRSMLALGAVVTAAALGAIAWRLGMHAARLAGDGATTNSLLIPFAPLGWFAAASAALSSVFALLRGVASLRREQAA